jgi:protein phosphatase
VRAGAASHVGLVRGSNEDRALTSINVFAVADGMGGHAAGEVASSLAAARLEELGDRPELTADDVRAALLVANADILADAGLNPERAGMGTTAAGIANVVVAGSAHWAVFNVGDSRVYRFESGEFAQLTVDHSQAAELLAAGEITPAEAAGHPLQNVLTRALGMDPAPEVDLWVFPPTPGERFLICSDGLPLELVDGEMASVLRTCGEAQQTADELVRLAVQAGGRDNITAVVVDYQPDTDSEVDGETTPRPAP